MAIDLSSGQTNDFFNKKQAEQKCFSSQTWGRIATECVDVLFDPLQGGDLIKQTEIAHHTGVQPRP